MINGEVRVECMLDATVGSSRQDHVFFIFNKLMFKEVVICNVSFVTEMEM